MEYYSPSAGARHDLARRVVFADGMRHRGLAELDARLATPQTTEPPTFAEVAGRLGWDATTERVERWAAAGGNGHFGDPEYDDPSPLDLPDGDL
jgi:hypothetical protein